MTVLTNISVGRRVLLDDLPATIVRNCGDRDDMVRILLDGGDIPFDVYVDELTEVES